MDTQTETNPGATVAENPSTPGEAAAITQPESKSDKLARLLREKEEGRTLTKAEIGFIGGMQPKKKRPTNAQLAITSIGPVPAEIPPDNPLFEPPKSDAMPTSVPIAPVVSPEAIRKTADALLDSVDWATKSYVGYEAKCAGSDQQTVEAYESAVALQPRNRQLMVENSEPVVLALCKFFKCAPEQLDKYIKGSGFLAGAIAHGVGVVAAVKSIRESKKEKPPPETKQ